ncbi:MAG: hypothetical protein JWP35_4666 [Caulobacter sp.]|nr:hypothetical protein [Caulobacter sp.]
MSDQIRTYYAQQYASTIALLSQQKTSRLSGAVRIEPLKGKAASPVEQLGATAAKKRTTRYAPIQPSSQPADRPWVYPVDYDWDDMIDSADKLRLLIDPQSAYVQNGTAAMNRAKDDEIIAAFFADRQTGENGTNVTIFPTGATNVVPVATGGTGAVGLNVAKLRAGKKLLMAADIDLESEEIYCAITASQHDNLLGEIQVISADFNGGDRPVLKDGKVERFLGINFIHSERLLLNGSSQRRNPLWVKSGVCLGIWNEIETDVSQRKDLEGHPWQVYLQGTFGGSRLEEKKVIELPCAES